MKRRWCFGPAVAVALWTAPALADHVTVWHAYREGGDEEAALREVLARFRTAHPGTDVEELAVPFEGYASKLAAAIPAGNGPDIFLDAHERLGDFKKRGLVASVRAALPEGTEGDFAKTALDAAKLDGVPYGIPLSRKCLALFVNDALVPRDPASLEDLAALKHTLPADVVPVAHVTSSAYAHAPILAAFGGTLLTLGDTFGMDSPEGDASVDFILQWQRDHVVPEEVSGALVSELFAAGKAATAIGGPWMAGDLHGDVKYHVIPLPKLLATGRTPRPLLTVELAMMTPNGVANAPAIALATYLGGEDAAELRAKVGRSVSARTLEPPAARGDAFLSAFGKAADDAQPMPTSPAMRLVFEPADRALRKVLRGDATSKAALEEAAHRFEDVRRPLPTAADSTPYAAFLGLLALAGAAFGVRRAFQAEARARVKASLPAYAYVSLAAIAVVVLVALPLVVGASMSFFAGRGDEARFVGLAHYFSILTARGGPLLASGSFYLVLLVTLLWTVANLCLHVLFGVSLGLLLSRKALRLKAVYRVLLIIPWAVPSYVTALAWKGLFHRQFGAINAILSALGAEPVSWFSRFSTAFTANLATNVWLGFPFVMVVTMGAITSVPDDVLEAAEVDGASRWQRLSLVTLPLIRPVLAPAIALGAVWTFNMFNVVFLVSGGDPDGTTDILVSEAYRWAFTREAQIGYAAAYAVLIFLLLSFGTRLAERVAGRERA